MLKPEISQSMRISIPLSFHSFKLWHTSSAWFDFHLFYSYTFETVKANSEKYWKFGRYSVIVEYEEKIPSPINIPFRIFQLLRWVLQSLCSNKCTDKDKQGTIRAALIER